MKNNFAYVVIIVLLLLLSGVFYALWRLEKDASVEKILSYENKLTTKTNDLDQEVAQNHLIVDSYMDFKAVTKLTENKKDSELVRLRSLVTKSTSSAIALTTKTTAAETGETTLMFDTTGDPVYESDIVTEWDSVHVKASRDQTKITYLVYNKFDIKQSWKRKGFFKREEYVEITSLNPHTQTIGLRAFKLEDAKKNRGLWFILGAVAASTAIYYLR